MSPAKRRMSNVLIFSAILLIAIGISAGLYFFKIQKNEDYQNQLHFRELNVAAHSFHSSLTQFKRVGKTVLNSKGRIEQLQIEINKKEKHEEVLEKDSDLKVALSNAEIALERFQARTRASASLRHFELVPSSEKELLKGLHVSKDSYSYFVHESPYKSVTNADGITELIKDEEGDKGSIPLVKVPTTDFLPSTLLSFPLVMIADETGTVLAHKEYYDNSTNAADLQFKTVKMLLDALGEKQRLANNIDDTKSPMDVTYSGTIELLVSSITYRIFIQPVSSSKISDSDTTYYVLGFVPLSDMQLDKLSVSSTTGLWILMALLILTAAIPILKIRFIPSKHLYSQTDISLFFAGTILLLGIISITLNHNMFYSYLINTKYLQAESIFKAIGNDFREEVKQINDLAQDETLVINPLKESKVENKDTAGENKNTTGSSNCEALVVQKGAMDSTVSENKHTIGTSSCEAQVVPKKAMDSTANENKHTTGRSSCEAQVVQKNAMDSSTGKTVKTYNCKSNKLHFTFTDAMGNDTSSFVEGIFRLNPDGVIVRKAVDWEHTLNPEDTANLYREPIIRISEEANNFGDFHMGHRAYFKRAINCDLWFAEENDRSDCKKGFIIQRIKNVSDARLSTQFAYAEFSNKSAEMNERQVRSASVKLRTFFARILPENFGYAVFDQDGLVLYHSDESRVLQENILVDTYGDENIQTLMHSASRLSSQTGTSISSVRFATDYRDAQALFVGGALDHAVPWKLVVFFKTESLARSSLWMVIFSVSLSFCLLILVFIWNRFGTKQYFWSKLLSFAPEHAEQYSRFAWVLMGGIVFCLLSMGILVDLYGRISLWFLVLCGLVSWLSIKLEVIPFNRKAWAHPSVPFAFLATIFGLLFYRNHNPDSFSFENADIAFFAVGSVFFALTMFFAWFKPSSNEKLVRNSKISNWCKHNLPKFILTSSVRPFRYTQGYVVYLAALLWLFSIVPANMFINATNHFLLDYQAYNQTRAFDSALQANQTAIDNYLHIFKPPPAKLDTGLEELNSPQKNSKQTSLNNREEKNIPGTLFYHLLFAQGNPSMPDSKSERKFDWITVENTQAYVDPMLNSMASDQGIGGSIHKGFYHFAQAKRDYQQLTFSEKQQSITPIYVNYNGNRFLVNALNYSGVNIFFSTIVLFLVTLLFAKKYIVHRIMGEHLPDNFRTFEPTYTNLCFEQIIKIRESRQRIRVQLIRTPASTVVDSLKSCLGGKAVHGKMLSIQELLLQSDVEQDNFMSSLESYNGEGDFIVLRGLEGIAFNPTQRLEALRLLERIDRLEHLSIILVCDIAPLFRLCKQHAYPGVDPECYAKIDEIVAWTNLLFKYEKLYNWNPSSKKRNRSNATVQDVLDHEGKGWPALGNIKALFEVQAAKHTIEKWKPDQIIEFFASHAGAIYRDKWEVCTTDERFTLFQLANGASVNPGNLDTLEQLVKRGYIYRDCGWFIVNESFRRFILFAELESTFAQWMDNTNSSTWQFVRVPILVAVLVLAGVVIIGTGQSLQSVLATATATLGVMPLLLRNLNFFRGTPAINTE
jgi:hypothetical protein